MSQMLPSVEIADGVSAPILGYGTGTAWFKKAPGDLDRSLIESLKTAIKIGFRHLDGAEIYNTEEEIGIAIKESNVPRDQLFVTTKVIKNIENIEGAIDASLKKLQLSYVDLYLIHMPFFAKTDKDLQNAWEKMEAVLKSGKARAIGVSNYSQANLEATLKTANVKPAINQIELHPYLQHGDLIEYHRSHGIKIAAYGPITPIVRAKGGPVDSIVAQLAEKYSISESNILLRWAIQRGDIAITTSAKESRLVDCLKVSTFSLLPEEVETISKAGSTKHFRAFLTEHYDPDDRK